MGGDERLGFALMPVSPLSPFGPTRLVFETGLNVTFFPVAVICAYIRFLPPLVMAKKYSPTTGARLKLSVRQSKLSMRTSSIRIVCV